MTVDRSVEAISAALRSGSDQFVVRIPVGLRGEVELVRNGRPGADRRRPQPVPGRGLVAPHGDAGGVGLRPPGDGRRGREAPVRALSITTGRGPARASARSRSASGWTAATLDDPRAADLPRRPLHQHARRHAPPGTRVRGRPCRWGPTNTSSWATTARCRTTRGSGPSARSCRARCSWASRSSCTCRARSSRSRSSAGRFAGFPIPVGSVTFDKERSNRGDRGSAGRLDSRRWSRPGSARRPGPHARPAPGTGSSRGKGTVHDGTVLRHSACRRQEPQDFPHPPRAPPQGRLSGYGRGHRRRLHPRPGGPRIRSPGLRDPHRLDGPDPDGPAQGGRLPPVRLRLRGQCLRGGRAPSLSHATSSSGLCVNCRYQDRRPRRGTELQGGPHPGHDVPLRPALPARQRPARAVGRRRLPLPRGAGGQLHQAPGRACPARSSGSPTATSTSSRPASSDFVLARKPLAASGGHADQRLRRPLSASRPRRAARSGPAGSPARPGRSLDSTESRYRGGSPPATTGPSCAITTSCPTPSSGTPS